MSKVVAKNAIILTAVEIISKLVELVGFVFLARILGAEKYGLMNFAYTVGTMFCLLPHFGFDQLVVRDVSRQQNEAGKYFTGIAVAKMILFLVTLAIMTVWLECFSHYDAGRKAVLYLGFLSVFVLTNIYFTSAFFRAFQKAYLEAIIRITLAVMVMAVSIASVLILPNVLQLFVVRLFVAALAFFLSVFLIVRILKVGLLRPVQWSDIAGFFNKGWPFAVFTFFIVVYISIDIVMLSMMAGDAATGFYSVASKIIIFFLIIPTGIANALLPAMSQKVGADPHGFKVLADQSIRLTLIIAIASLMFNVLMGPLIIRLFFGEAYAPSGLILVLLAFMIVPAYLNQVGNTILLAFNREKMIIIFAAAGAVINIGLNFFLIPSFSFYGAAIATILTELFIVMVQFIYIRSSVYADSDFVRDNSIVFLSGIFLTLVMMRLPIHWVPISFVPAVALYTFFLFRSKFLSKDQLLSFWSYLRNRTVTVPEVI